MTRWPDADPVVRQRLVLDEAARWLATSHPDQGADFDSPAAARLVLDDFVRRVGSSDDPVAVARDELSGCPPCRIAYALLRALVVADGIPPETMSFPEQVAAFCSEVAEGEPGQVFASAQRNVSALGHELSAPPARISVAEWREQVLAATAHHLSVVHAGCTDDVCYWSEWHDPAVARQALDGLVRQVGSAYDPVAVVQDLDDNREGGRDFRLMHALLHVLTREIDRDPSLALGRGTGRAAAAELAGAFCLAVVGTGPSRNYFNAGDGELLGPMSDADAKILGATHARLVASDYWKNHDDAARARDDAARALAEGIRSIAAWENLGTRRIRARELLDRFPIRWLREEIDAQRFHGERRLQSTETAAADLAAFCYRVVRPNVRSEPVAAVSVHGRTLELGGGDDGPIYALAADHLVAAMQAGEWAGLSDLVAIRREADTQLLALIEARGRAGSYRATTALREALRAFAPADSEVDLHGWCERVARNLGGAWNGGGGAYLASRLADPIEPVSVKLPPPPPWSAGRSLDDLSRAGTVTLTDSTGKVFQAVAVGVTGADPVPVPEPEREPFSFAVSDGEQFTLENAVAQAIGAASVCWDNVEAAGQFDSTRAKEIADTLVAWIRDGSGRWW